MIRRRAVLAVGALLVAVLAGCGGGDDGEGGAPAASTTADAGDGAGDTAADAATTSTTVPPLPDGWAGHVSEVYADPAHWICRGDTDDVCDRDLDATVVHEDGTTELERFEPVADAPVDCFYVYPTISGDPTVNSDLVPTEEIPTTVVQAARYGSLCRVFAPVYRQVTLAALFGRLEGSTAPSEDAREIAYADVVDAFKHYMANDNGGRGVVLMGHSQGSGILARLLQEEFDGDDDEAMRARLVSAMLLGAGVTVPAGADVGGDLERIALCRAPDDVGCVVSYASFRSTAPPDASSFFGRTRDGDGDGNGTVVACNNPAALAGGRVPLTGYWATEGRAWLAGTTIETPFVKVPGLVDGECVERDGFSFLEVTVNADPSGPRIDEIRGDLTPEWGLHLVDVQLTLADAVSLVDSQIAAFTTR